MAGEWIIAIPLVYAIQKWACRNDPPPKKTKAPPPAQPPTGSSGKTAPPPQPQQKPPPPPPPPAPVRGELVRIGDDVYEMKKIVNR